MSIRPENVLRRPIALTEKASLLKERNQVVFEVSRDANKLQIKDAVKALYNVEVTAVNTMIMRGKTKRMGRGVGKFQNWKKAVVTLAEGQTIDFFGGDQT